MSFSNRISRRRFIQSVSSATAGVLASDLWLPRLQAHELASDPLTEFSYGDVSLHSDLHESAPIESKSNCR